MFKHLVFLRMYRFMSSLEPQRYNAFCNCYACFFTFSDFSLVDVPCKENTFWVFFYSK